MVHHVHRDHLLMAPMPRFDANARERISPSGTNSKCRADMTVTCNGEYRRHCNCPRALYRPLEQRVSLHRQSLRCHVSPEDCDLPLLLCKLFTAPYRTDTAFWQLISRNRALVAAIQGRSSDASISSFYVFQSLIISTQTYPFESCNQTSQY